METAFVLAAVVLANLVAATVGKDTRDGRDWQPADRIPRPRPPAAEERGSWSRSQSPARWSG